MSDNKKYYYLKLKDNFFESEQIIILESMPNGYIFSNILLKLYLRSLRGNGLLMFSPRIPYSISVLAKILRHDEDIVSEAMNVLIELDLVEIKDNGAIYMTEIQNFIGRSSTEADRQRKYYDKIKNTNAKEINNLDSSLKVDEKKCKISTPEKEKKKEKEKDIEKEKEIEKEQDCDLTVVSDSPLFSFPYSRGTYNITQSKLDAYKKRFPTIDILYELSNINTRFNDPNQSLISTPKVYIDRALENAVRERGGKTRLPQCAESELKTLRFSSPEMMRIHGRIREYVIANDIGSHIVPEFYQKFCGSDIWSGDWLGEFVKFVKGGK